MGRRETCGLFFTGGILALRYALVLFAVFDNNKDNPRLEKNGPILSRCLSDERDPNDEKLWKDEKRTVSSFQPKWCRNVAQVGSTRGPDIPALWQPDLTTLYVSA